MSILFKKCGLSDLDKLVAISKKTFIEAFEKDNNPDDFKTYLDLAFTTSTIKKQLENPDSTFYFVLKDAFLIGYLKLNTNNAQSELQDNNSIEIERIYVLKEHQGKQFGRQMLRFVFDIGVKKKKTYIWLGVWQKNLDAIRFYEKHGFQKFDTHPYYIGSDKQTDWLMRFDLSNFQAD